MEEKHPSQIDLEKCVDAVPEVCEYLVHYHVRHTHNAVSRFTSPDREVEIFVVSTPECRKRFEQLYLELMENIGVQIQ